MGYKCFFEYSVLFNAAENLHGALMTINLDTVNAG